jgi:hypothetical protein
MLLTAALAASLYVGGVAAHGGVIAYSIDGKYYDGWKPYNSASGQTSIQRPWATLYAPLVPPLLPRDSL